MAPSGLVLFTNIRSTATNNAAGSGWGLFTRPTDHSTRLPANNDNGHGTRFSNIDPDTDGKIVLTPIIDGNVVSQYAGKYGSAIRLVEE